MIYIQTLGEARVNNVTSLTIHDDDSESNIVELQSQYFNETTGLLQGQGRHIQRILQLMVVEKVGF